MTIIKVEHIGTQKFIYTPEIIDETFYITVKDEETNEEKQIEVNDISCELEININLKTYKEDGQRYYINYVHTYNGDTKEKRQLAQKLHPMYNNMHFMENDHEQSIIYKNTLTDKLVNYLLKPFDDLRDVNSEYHSSYEYQKQLLDVVSVLWD